MMNMLAGELADRDDESKKSLFVLSKRGEWRAMIRPNGIQIRGLVATLGTVSADCMHASQSAIEPFSGNALQEADTLHLF